MASLLERAFRMGEGRSFSRIQELAGRVNAIEGDYRDLTDAEIRSLTDTFRRRLQDGASMNALLPEAFATVREASRRTLGQRHFDVQVMAGTALHLGYIAEMATGAGKTLVASLPSYLNALSGDGVHVVTVNDYLAGRDAEKIGRIHRFLGLTVGVVLSDMSPEARRGAYLADITYATGTELGFDYLNDNMAPSRDGVVQRGHNYVLIDEVDSVLIDDARTPLIISGPADELPDEYARFAAIAEELAPDHHYELDTKLGIAALLEPGIDYVEAALGVDNFYRSEHAWRIRMMENALKAKELFTRDRDYIVADGEVQIVDVSTGRVLEGRRFSDGVHQALEAKENVEVQPENQTLATVTAQNYFRLYKQMSGMTGTARSDAPEFHRIYGLDVVQIPDHKPPQRIDRNDKIFRTNRAKFEAVAESVADRHRRGQPVLIGTVSVEKSESLSDVLRERGIPHEVLNARHIDREAAIVARAGRLGAVTVATNMAGRGTDIMLGGNPEFEAEVELRERGLDPVADPEAYEQEWIPALERKRAESYDEHKRVLSIGGLCVIGTERHESRRIDDQLRGRSGRQGDPGETRFYLSLEDDLLQRFKVDWIKAFLHSLHLSPDEAIKSPRLTAIIDTAQAEAEAVGFEERKHVLRYDDVLDGQRRAFYGARQALQAGDDIPEHVRTMIRHAFHDVVTRARRHLDDAGEAVPLFEQLAELYPIGVDRAVVDRVVETRHGWHDLVDRLVDDADLILGAIEEDLGRDELVAFERRVILEILDRRWREHLYELDALRDAVQWRASAGRDPLVEFTAGATHRFEHMSKDIEAEVAEVVLARPSQARHQKADTPVGRRASNKQPTI
ncbi:preprotein translocase subunit SecA [Mycolicibacterium sp. 3033]|nr:preprotein translocase subunit SecA [Mycolicibacterium aurantiacum]